MQYLKFISFLFFITVYTHFSLSAQKTNISVLSIDQIMQGEQFIGHLPSDIEWSVAGDRFYFYWNPENAFSDSLYAYDLSSGKIAKVAFEQRYELPQQIQYNASGDKLVYTAHGDIFYQDLKNGKKVCITATSARESNPAFVENDTKVVYSMNRNLYTWDIQNGTTTQITDFKNSGKPTDDNDIPNNPKDKWLYEQQLSMFTVLAEKKPRRKPEKQNLKKKNKCVLYLCTFRVNL